ncbi:hypothetical protein [Citrobacter sp. JGM124]|uniref:hypothetical protein n=1 Tax=Citrobacter sp. JGM124 TaxID=2799789 RepID=UPI001BA7BC6B|nr:hypothetical protein [Citrobacter sp. JGM124]MBS0848497.1 hypothetical protein [Citrobacter sp. JGM124]
MIQRIAPFLIGITFLINGCANTQDKQSAADFNDGSTLLKVAHLASPTADGSALFITVDGKDAGFLPVGQAILLHVPAGKHEVGGYARSLIGHVTIPGITVTTSLDVPRFVAYKVTQYDPLFTLRGIDPLPQSAPLPEKQVAKSEPLPQPKIVELSTPENNTVSDTSSTPTPEANPTPVAQENASQPAPAVISATPALPPVITDSSQGAVSDANAVDAATDASQTVPPPQTQISTSSDASASGQPAAPQSTKTP